MSVINLAFSAGIESTYLLQKLMEEGHTVNVVFCNLSSGAAGYAAEMLRAKQIIDYFKERRKEIDSPYTGVIDNVYWNLSEPYTNALPQYRCRDRFCFGDVTTQVTNQYALVDIMMKVRRDTYHRHYPTTVIGWIKDDAIESSLCEYDFSEAEYQELLNLPVRLGRLNNSDNVAKPFRAPLWKMPKKHIWLDLDSNLKRLVIGNGKAVFEDGVLIHTIADAKRHEYKVHEIPFQEKVEIPIPDDAFGFYVRFLMRATRAIDFDLPSEADGFYTEMRDKYLLTQPERLTTSDIIHFKETFISSMSLVHLHAAKFVWPVPAPTVEVFADVGEGAERVELEGDQ